MGQIVLSDSSLNKYGFRVETSGLDISEFKKNPVLFFNHRRGLPLGRWDGLKIKGDQLLGVPEFDQEDEEALKIEGKYDRGFLKGASIGFKILELSDDPEDMVKGQTRPTVKKALVYEASITDIPANSNAYRLEYKGKVLELNDETTEEELNQVLGTISQTNTPKMKKIAEKLGLAENATEEQILSAIESLSAPSTELEALKAKQNSLVESLLSLGEKAGTVTEKNKAKFKALAENDISLAADFILPKGEAATEEKTEEEESTKENLSVQGLLKSLKLEVSNNKDKTDEVDPTEHYLTLSRSGELEKMRTEKPEEYSKVVNAYLEAN